MAHESRMYQDPYKYLEFKQEKTCKGCEHQSWVEFGETRVDVCKLDKKHGNRCKNYEERK